MKETCSHCEGQQTWLKNYCTSEQRPICGSDDCTSEQRPICGSNGKTYGNMCLFKNKKCKEMGSITILHEGPCALKGVLYLFTQLFWFFHHH